jgi:putative ABC transport system permease protein
MILLTGLIGGMGLLGLLLALSGLYAVTAWSVTRRTRELGIRMAVGADRRNILAMVLGQGLRLGLVGIAVGLVPSLFFGRLLTASLKAPPFNMPFLAGVLVALLAMTAVGAFVPARRASRLDPIRVLKEE